MLPKLKYFLVCLKKFMTSSSVICPSCGCSHSMVVDRKYLITALRRCESCKLLFRTPITTPTENQIFYQKEYSQGLTTEMPSSQELEKMLTIKFRHTEKDFSNYINILKALGCQKGDSLLDFGCSWGYGSWQLMDYGFSVRAFEISAPRCTYARKYLNVDAYTSLNHFNNQFDIFFSSHVLEHVPSVSKIITYGWQILRPGGLFIAFTPNGSNVFRKSNPNNWHKLWGLVHPNLLDEVYYNKTFQGLPKILASNPYFLDKLTLQNCHHDVNDLSGPELLLAVRKPL